MPPPHNASFQAAWRWSGTHTSGMAMRGHLLAAGPFHARAVLRRQGIRVERLRRSWWRQGANALSLYLLGMPVLQRWSPKERVAFFRQWASLMEAGLPLLGALELLAQTAVESRWGLVVHRVVSDLRQGSRLGHALSRHPEAFDSLTCALIQAAESAAALTPMLSRLAQDHERRLSLQKKVQSALTYPAVVLTVCLAVMGVILVWVVPAFEEVYQALGSELPSSTRLLLSLAQQVRSSAWAFLLSLLLGSGIALRQWQQHPALQRWVARQVLRVPIWGALVSGAAVARWSRTLATLCASGLSLSDALGAAAPACGHSAFAQATLHIQREVTQGHSLSTSLKSSGIFPHVVMRLVAVGEESGQMEAMLVRVAQYHEEELDRLSRALTVALEPLLIVLMGTVVGLAVMTLYWPLFNLGSAL